MFKVTDTYLCGYYGMQNTGDDALMYAAAWGARTFCQSQSMSVSTPRPVSLPFFGACKQTLQQKQTFAGQNRFNHYANALRSKSIIFGGGSVFHNAHDINMKLDMMRLAGSKSYALGVGLGPFKDGQAEKACAKLLNRCRFVGLRDAESFDVARAIAPRANVHKTFDLAPLLLLESDFELQQIPRSGIAVNLCPVENLSGCSQADLERVDAMANALNDIGQHHDEPIYLLTINGHSQFGDSKLLSLLKQKLDRNLSVRTVKYDANPHRVLQRMASYKMVLSMRLHGCILGYLADTPTVSLNYHTKCDAWCKDIEMPNSMRVQAAEPCSEKIYQAVKSVLIGSPDLPRVSKTTAIKKSLENWRFAHDESEFKVFSHYSLV